MGLRTWILENRLRRIDAKLRQLRYKQKKLRDQEAELVKARKGGLGPIEAKTREEKLHHEKETVTHEVNRLVVQEERTKAELREMGIPTSGH